MSSARALTLRAAGMSGATRLLLLSWIAVLVVAAGFACWTLAAVGGDGCVLGATSRPCAVAAGSAAAIGGLSLAAAGLLACLLPPRLMAVWCGVLWAIVAASVVAGLLSGPRDPASVGVAFGRVSYLGLLAAGLVAIGAWAGSFLRRDSVRRAVLALWRHPAPLLVLVAIVGLTTIHVLSSHRVLYWDPMTYWEKTDQVARAGREGIHLADWLAWLRSAADEYAVIPAVLPGLLTVHAPAYNLLSYMLAVGVSYVFPATLAIGWLGLVLARSVGRVPPAGEGGASSLDLVVLGAAAGLSLFPIFAYTFLVGVRLDIGGVPVIVGLVLAWDRCVRTIARDDKRTDPDVRALELTALGALIGLLSLFAFVFRRWYVFDVVGVGVAAGACVCAMLLGRARPRHLVLRDALIVLAASLICILSAGAPVIERWITSWESRQYGALYASYWVDWRQELANFIDCFGLLAPVLCVAGLLWALTRRRARPLAAVLLGGTGLAVLAIHHVQMMWWQHYYLLMPLLAGTAAAGAILLATRIGVRAVAFGLVPVALFMALAARHRWPLALVQPAVASLRPQNDPNLPELLRLGRWLKDALGPQGIYCVAASSLSLNGSVVQNLWQADRSLLGSRVEKGLIWINEVDSRDGPPDARVKRCDVIVAASPPQTHLMPEGQQSVVLLADDVLSGTGVGAAFAKSSASFQLEGGVMVTPYARQRPVADAELSALRQRWYAAKGDAAPELQARFGAP